MNKLTIMFIIWVFLVFQKIFFTQFARQSVIVSNKLVSTSCVASCPAT